MSTPNHFSSPMLSNWQSAVAKIVTKPGKNTQDHSFERNFLDFKDTIIAAAAEAAHAVNLNLKNGATLRITDGPARCAKIALNLARCRIQHDEEGVRDAEAQLSAMGTCDPRWLECIGEFLEHYTLTTHGNVPYVNWKSIDDFIICDALPEKCRIGILGDWGTGDRRAQDVLEAMNAHEIDLFIHLGDIYYSCTTSEANLFHDNIRKIIKRTSRQRIFTLCGNHDVYSGGAPYYALINRLNQPASYFCLRNNNWQILAADTGYNDFDPRGQGGLGSYVQDRELEWHNDKFETAGGRRTIMLSHHQPFSLNAAIDGSHGVNSRLTEQFRPNFEHIPLWIWGHEHNQVVYKPFIGLERGRCLGAGAIPVPKDVELYVRDRQIEGEVPDIEDVRLSIDSKTDLYNLGFGILELDGGRCREQYYEYDTSSKSEKMLFESNF